MKEPSALRFILYYPSRHADAQTIVKIYINFYSLPFTVLFFFLVPIGRVAEAGKAHQHAVTILWRLAVLYSTCKC